MSNEPATTAAIQPKQHFTGKVLKTTMAGALVDIGLEVPGVVHISQIQKDPVNKVEEILQEGQSVDVWVRRAKADRIELTMIQPLAYDWKELQSEMVVKGKVVRLESYGAFVDFGAERPGMIHVSELAHGFVKTPGDIVKEGDEIEAMIIEVDRRKKQIRLSAKAIAPKPEEKEEVEAPRTERKSKGKRTKGVTQDMGKLDSTSSEPEPTVFELAWQAALDRQKAKKVEQKTKKAKIGKDEQEEILNRTLEKRLPTGA
jgi:small subunit ribosomal protein S1